VSPVKYELRFYIPEDDTLHSHRRENLKPSRAKCCLRNLIPRNKEAKSDHSVTRPSACLYTAQAERIIVAVCSTGI
jgi:hypothetical protein